jgi:DedD protein
MLQIKGEDFLKKVQLQQEKEELERKLSQLDESRVSINSINTNNNFNDTYDTNINRNSMNNKFEDDSSEFDNIMLENPTIQNNTEDNKKKYLILGILLVVLFLLTIIIIRLLTSDPKSEDQFTSSNSSPEMKALAQNSSAIDANYQKIVDTQKERKEASVQETTTQTAPDSTQTQLNTVQEPVQNLLPLNEPTTTSQTSTTEPVNSISN